MPARQKPELVLGTAQLGLDYGITNRRGQPDPAEAHEILAAAETVGISALDTARAYGTSEEVIGRYLGAHRGRPFTTLTKLDPGLDQQPDSECIREAVRTSLSRSRGALGCEHLDCVMLHRPAHMRIGGGIVLDVLQEERDAGRIGRIGVSLSYPEELFDALAHPAVRHVQFPFNLLDHRFDDPAIRKRLADHEDVQVHVRSVFLQGLIIGAAADDLERRFGAPGRDMGRFLEDLPARFQQASRLHAALAFVRSMGWIDGVVVGVPSAAELREIASAFHAPVSADFPESIRENRPRLSADILDPAKWTA